MDPRVETGEIVVLYFFLVANVVVKFDGVRAVPVESIPWIDGIL